MKKPALTPDSLLKYAAGVSALVVVSESASAAPPVSNILSFSVNQQLTFNENFAPFTGALETGTRLPSISQLGLHFSGIGSNMYLVANTGSGYRWIGSGTPSSFTQGADIAFSSSHLNYGGYGGYYSTPLPGIGSTKYFGFKSISGNNYVGWASVANSSGSYFLTGFGMETGGATSIAAGATAIPEPAESVALLALGALGVAALRRRNQAKATANAA